MVEQCIDGIIIDDDSIFAQQPSFGCFNQSPAVATMQRQCLTPQRNEGRPLKASLETGK